MDDLDIKLLDLLAEDANRSIGQIADQLGIVPSSASRRVKSLVSRGIIRRFTLDIDYEKLGIGVRAYVLGRFGERNIEHKDVLKRIQNHPNVVSVASLFGAFDLIVELITKSAAELTEIVQFIREQAGQIDVSTYIVASHGAKQPSILGLSGSGQAAKRRPKKGK